MLGFPFSVRIFLFMEAVDMRKGPDGLGSLVRAAGHDLFDGTLFVFLSKQKNRAKILTYERGGLVVWYKRLDRGRFQLRQRDNQSVVELDSTALTMLLDGIDIRAVRRPEYWVAKISKRGSTRKAECDL